MARKRQLQAKRRPWLTLTGSFVENFFNLGSQHPGDCKSERQAGIVTFIFNCVDGLPGNGKASCKFALRPAFLHAKWFQFVLHRKRRLLIKPPTIHKAPIKGQTKNMESLGYPTLSRNP